MGAGGTPGSRLNAQLQGTPLGEFDEREIEKTDGIRVFDEWTEDVDLSLDPEPGQMSGKPGPGPARQPARNPEPGPCAREIPIKDLLQSRSISLDSTVLLAPPPAARSGSRWLVGFGLSAAALALVLGLGSLGAVLVAGAAMGGAFVLFVPAVDVVLPPPPDAHPVVVEAPAPPAESAPVAPRTEGRISTARKGTRKVEAPAAPPADVPAPGGEVEAQLVVMPDPGFRSQPLDKSIEQLNAKGDAGQIGVVAGH